MSKPRTYTYIIEHLDTELEAWSALEYKAIAEESRAAGADFLLTSVPTALRLPAELQGVPGLRVEHRGVEELYAGARKAEVCLLDPKAERELSPEDGDVFSVFLFGGILGDDPPRDRTSELRAKGFAGRRLGPVQMTTDTAVRVTRTVAQGNPHRVALDEIPYVDQPELRVDAHESVQMPFRYVRAAGTGEPVMPKGMRELIARDAEKGIEF